VAGRVSAHFIVAHVRTFTERLPAKKSNFVRQCSVCAKDRKELAILTTAMHPQLCRRACCSPSPLDRNRPVRPYHATMPPAADLYEFAL